MAKAAPPPPPPPPAPIDVSLRDALEERYLAYALSTIMGRALPDARDGLKPVHRRILYGMHILKLDPGTAFKKCAKIVGDVMGSFHPHGDQAIYEALVRLAQDFSSRYPLIEGQGNFGNIDGDNAAAYRYTEARMTDVARLLMEGVEEDSVDWRDNYSGDAREPIVMPSAVPNLLANGAQGIAVGMATSVPPHNIAELCDAALYLIAHPEADTEALAIFVPGPDFPTGGVVIDGRAAIVETYRTGRGAFRLRARWKREDTGRGGWAAVVEEIPYGVQKSRLIEQIANLLNEKKLPLLGDVRDESTEDVRIVLEPRSRTVEPATLMKSLFKLTELETRVSVNMNVLVDGVTPKVVSLRDALQQWLDHRRVVLVRRSRHRLAAIDKRLELLAGMIIVFLNLDEVIRIIREAEDPKEALKSRFALSELQVVYVLDTRLRSLRRLEEMALRKEEDDLAKEKASIEALIESERKQWQTIAAEVRDVKKKFGPETRLGRRRTGFEAAPDVVADLAEAMIDREPLTVVVSQKGWIRALKGQVADLSTATFKGDDALETSFFAETTSKLLVLASDGKAFALDASKLPGGRGQGEPIRLMADIDESAAIVAVWAYAPGAKRLVVASDGNGFIVDEDDLLSATRKGRAVLNVRGKATAALIVAANGDHVAVIGQNRKLLVFPASQLNEMARGKGTRLQRYKEGGVSDAKVFSIADGLTLARFGGAHLHRCEAGARRMDRQPRRSRPPAAEGVSEEQSVRGVAASGECEWRTGGACLLFATPYSLFSSALLFRQGPAVARQPDAFARARVETQPAHLVRAAAAESLAELAAHFGVLGAFTGDEDDRAEKPGGPGLRLIRRPGDEQHLAARVGSLEREKEPPAGLQRVEPDARRMRGGGVDIDGVGLRQVSSHPRFRPDLDLRGAGQILPRALGDVGLDLVGDDLACRADEMGEDGRVIARPGADLHRRLALLERERLDAHRVQGRLAVVDPPPGVDRDQHVVVEAGEIVAAGSAGRVRRRRARAGDRSSPRAARRRRRPRRGDR